MGAHEDTRSAAGADLAKALHLARVVHLVELEDAKLHLLVLVLLLLGLGVSLLLTLLSTTQQAKGDVQVGVVSNAALDEGSLILELATGEHHTLLIGGDALASLDGCLDISYSGLGAELQDLSPVCK